MEELSFRFIADGKITLFKASFEGAMFPHVQKKLKNSDFMKDHKVSEALIGLSLKDDQINWKWDDNSEVDYINWDKNEPNHVMSSEYLVEMLLHGRWNDVPDEHNRVAICQISCEEKVLPSEDPNKWKKYDPEAQEAAKLLFGENLVVNQTEN